MVRANELRPGNWLNYNEDGNWRPLKLNYVAKDENGFKGWYAHFGWCAITLEDTFNDGDLGVSGIPISSEILENIFRTKDISKWNWEYSNDLFISINRDCKVELCFDLKEYEAIEYTHIIYLHQLQNLFFSLTGTDLSITL